MLMCFSAGASFGASLLLTGIGISSVRKVKRPPEIMFASIPLLFAVQQATEGFLWLLLSSSGNVSMQAATAFIFILFAQVIWPFWVPLSIFLIDKKNGKNRVLQILTVTGVLVSLFLAYRLLAYPVEASIHEGHIRYAQDYPKPAKGISGVLYMVVTILPPFFSHLKKMKILGTAIFISYLATAFFYEEHIISVWCFFAALLSVLVLLVMFELRKTDSPIAV